MATPADGTRHVTVNPCNGIHPHDVTRDAPNPIREYGRHCRRVIKLTLGEIGALIMADLIRIVIDDDPDAAHLLDPDTYFPARIRFAAEVYPRHDTIRIMVHGLTDTELDHPFDTPADGSPCPIDYPEIIGVVADAYGWTNLDDPDDRRFLVRVTTLTEDEQTRDDDRPGEVRVYTHSVPPWLMTAAPAAPGFDESTDD